MVENNITYLCLTDEAEKRRIAFAFLDDIKERFLATYGSRAQTAIAYAMNGEFGPILQERMVSYGLHRVAATAGSGDCWHASCRTALALFFPLHMSHFSCLQQYFSTNPEADKFAAVRGKIDDVKGIMVQNIEKVLARGEKIELLVDKSDALNRSAAKFEKNSNKLKNQMWWRNGELSRGLV